MPPNYIAGGRLDLNQAHNLDKSGAVPEPATNSKGENMFWKKKEIDVRLLKELEDLKAENTVLKETLKEYLTPVKPKIQIQEEFDIENLKVISIERRPDRNGYQCSVFCYIIDGAPGEVQESYIRNTLQEHNDFVKRFRKKLKLEE